MPRLSWPLLAPLAAFAAWTVVAALASARPMESLLGARGLLTLGAFYVVLYALPDTRGASRFATGLFVAVTAVALLSIVQVGFCPTGGTVPPDAAAPIRLLFRKCVRARGFFSIYMTLAGVLVLVLLSALPRLALDRRRAAWAVPAWFTNVLALGLTEVRGAWVGFAVGGVGCALALRRRWLVLAALALVVAGVLAAEPGTLKRLRSVGDLRDETTRDRLAMLIAGLRLARANPVFGIGPGQVKKVYPTVATPEALRRSTSHLHDTPLQIVVERGVPGLVAWIAIWAAFFYRAMRLLRRIPSSDNDAKTLVIGSIAGIAAFLVAGLFEYNFGDTEVLQVALALMALPFVVERELDATGPELASGQRRLRPSFLTRQFSRTSVSSWLRRNVS